MRVCGVSACVEVWHVVSRPPLPHAAAGLRIGDTKQFDATKRMDPFDCALRENKGLTGELNRQWGAEVQT